MIIPINKYIANSIIHPLNIALGFLLIFLSGFAFWAALIPLTKIGKFKRLLLTLLFGMVLLILSYDFMKLNPLNGFKIIVSYCYICIYSCNVYNYIFETEENT